MAMDKDLFFGCGHIKEKMKNIQKHSNKRTIMLPISTRSSGFLIRSLMVKLQLLDVLNDSEIYSLTNALYRVTLFQIDYKIEEALLTNRPIDLMHSSFEDTFLSSDIRRALDITGVGFAPLVNYISAIGFFEAKGKKYLARHPKLDPLTCSPYFIRRSNIRSILERLASAEVHTNDTKNFLDRCPIPGAKWEITDQSIQLTNIDDIYPADYNLAALRDDIDIVSAAVEKVARKYPKYISPCRINWQAPGLVTQIVSTSQANLACPSYTDGGPIPQVIGQHSHFWAPEPLSGPEAYMGVVHLLGEAECGGVAYKPCMAIRFKSVACIEIYQDYVSAAVHNLI